MASSVFNSAEVKRLLYGKFVVFIGDSVVRCMYKDLVLLLNDDRHLDFGELRRRGERKFLGDELIEGGEFEAMTNGKNYREVRQYHKLDYLVRFYFITKCYNSTMETVMADLLQKPLPDIVIMNSCLWDITRYGPSSMSVYQVNLQVVFDMFKRILRPETLFIWTTTMPISEKVTGGVILKNISFLSSVLRVDVLMANNYATRLAAKNDFDVLDLHYYFRRKLHHRLPDGIHWDSAAHRQISIMLLSHVCSAWKIAPPMYWPRPKLSPDVTERIKWKTREQGIEQGGLFFGVTIKQDVASAYELTQEKRRVFLSSFDKSTTYSGTNASGHFATGPFNSSAVQSGGLTLRYRPY